MSPVGIRKHSDPIDIIVQKQCSQCYGKHIRMIDDLEEEYWCHKCNRVFHLFIEQENRSVADKNPLKQIANH